MGGGSEWVREIVLTTDVKDLVSVTQNSAYCYCRRLE